MAEMSEAEALAAWQSAEDADDAVVAWNQMSEADKAKERQEARQVMDIAIARDILETLAIQPPGSEQVARRMLAKYGLSE